VEKAERAGNKTEGNGQSFVYNQSVILIPTSLYLL
jgi:hypothetical protein